MKDFIVNQTKYYEGTHHHMVKDNHAQHDQEVDYWHWLAWAMDKVESHKPSDEFQHKNFAKFSLFDYGCGCGRNLKNLALVCGKRGLHDIRLFGCDISKQNADFAFKFARTEVPKVFYGAGAGPRELDGEVYACDGKSLNAAESEKQHRNWRVFEGDSMDLIMCTQVFQHIPNYDTRYSILSDMYRVLKEGGIAALHFMDLKSNRSMYHDNCEKPGNMAVINPVYVKEDLEKIGFRNVECATMEQPFWSPKASEHYFIAKK